MLQFPQVWNNLLFYQDSRDPGIARTVQDLQIMVADLEKACIPFRQWLDRLDQLVPGEYGAIVAAIVPIHQQRVELLQQLTNVETFISSCLSVNAQDNAARTWEPTLQNLEAKLDQAITPLQLFLNRVGDDFIAQLIQEPKLAELCFPLQCDRQFKDHLLNVVDEQIISGLSVHGLHSWGNLYTEIAGTLQCQLQSSAKPPANSSVDSSQEPAATAEVSPQAQEPIGLAQAANLLYHPDRVTREAAWRGIQTAWTSREETAATILNAINGWRLEETQQRANHSPAQVPLHYLDKSCHQNRIERTTLEALMATTYQRRSIGQRALNAMGKVLGIARMAPWDLAAPCPVKGDRSTHLSFETAIEIIADAFRPFDPAMADFAIMMADKGWIDAKPTPHRSIGAYCTGFGNPREPRIFMTFEGTMNNVITLAHELGHAWHDWVMRDLPWMQLSYPMTLAETASIFGETLVRQALLQQASTPAEQLAIRWQDAESAAVFLLNIPSRFEFEKQFVEARKQSFVIADELKQLMRNSWATWYETSLSEYDEMFWASKLHFSISSLGFYNYPYLFGYLFSRGIYAQKEQIGESFSQRYIDLLRDTGKMTAEAVVQHHLQQDIRQSDFWNASLDRVEQSVLEFEQLVATQIHP
ncbi:MAG: M3 family oligoendopeptidase [Synechococcales bacterium]|nr:M3 family oligoendopeptidase [Synechococcales bacterium]